jgi:pre-mRNA-splicing factor CWC26
VTAAAKTLRLKKSNWSLPSASSPSQPEPAPEDPPAGSSTATATSAPPVKKRKGGLLTAAQLKEEAEALAIEEARKEAEREQERLEARRRRRAEGNEDDEDLANGDDDDDDHPDHQRTVYRDRSGKIVDAQAERAEQLKAEAEDRARQAAKKDWNKGLVQRNQREVEAQRERQVASTSFAR